MSQNIKFELFAPYNEQVKLLGSWNNWQPIPMFRNEQGCWQVDVSLEDGHYEYHFEVMSRSYFADGKPVRVADPKALCLARHDPALTCVTIQHGQKMGVSYQWKHDDHPLPTNDELIIYEMNVADFYRGGANSTGENKGGFLDVIQKLDYLADLGINAIELIPVSEFPNNEHWGYCQFSFYAVENTYGSADELCRLVDEAHARGIRIIIDAVYNHMDPDAPLTQIDYTYWFYRENPDDKDLQFGPKFNFDFYDENLKISPAREYVINAMKFWLDTFHIDGIRFDAARALKNFDLMKWLSDEAHSKINFKPFITIAEYIPQNPAVAGPNGPMDAAWYESLSKQLMCTIDGIPAHHHEPFNTGELLRRMDCRNEGFASPYNVVTYIDNHDQDRIMWQLRQWAQYPDEVAMRRMKMGAALLMTIPGIPLIWMGQEFGASSPRTPDPTPLEWSCLDIPLYADLHRYYKQLMAFRKQNPALRGDTFETITHLPEQGIIAFQRWNTEGNVVLVLVNVKDQASGEVHITHGALRDGQWHDKIHNKEVRIENNTFVGNFDASEVKLLTQAG